MLQKTFLDIAMFSSEQRPNRISSMVPVGKL